MQTILKNKLHSYICEHNPDLIIQLDEIFSLNQYLEEKMTSIEPLMKSLIEEKKPNYIIQELCMNALTKELKPSRFLYLKNLVEEEFTGDYLMMQENGTLTFETLNILQGSQTLFEAFSFSEETADSKLLRYALIAFIKNYLEKN